MRFTLEQTNMAALVLFISRARFLNLLGVLGVLYIHIKESYTESPLEAGLHRKVSLGFIWENPRVEQHDASEVIVDGSRDELRLTCILTPPLPLTKESYISRDSIVKWMKVRKTHGNQVRNTFWSDGQDITAISLSKLKLHDLGTYGCSYQSLLKTINITVSGVDEIKRLPEPESHLDLESALLNVRNLNGFDSWKPIPSIQQKTLGVADFPCSTSNHGMKANSVNQLQPGDIDIILSLGGAFSAGVAANAKSIPGLFRSNKIYSFSIGGKFPVQNMLTLPGILKIFNPSLKGAVSQEEDFSTMHYGSSIRNLPLRASNLVKKLQSRRDIDFESSWKLLTMSLDFDDFCVACRLAAGWDDHIKAVVEALDILHAKVPRLFVNLVLAPNATQLYSLPSSRRCSKLFWKQCECLELNSQERNKVIEMQIDFKEYLFKIVQKYTHSPNFTVVIQPFWTDVYQDLDGLFAQDCFHLSTAGHEFAAINLWNNMLQPVNMKNSKWKLAKSFRCPTQLYPYLFTPTNSRVENSTDFAVADAADSGFPNRQKSNSKLKPALGIGLSFLVVVAVFVFVAIYVKRQRPISMKDRIRILATPWKRMKEKV